MAFTLKIGTMPKKPLPTAAELDKLTADFENDPATGYLSLGLAYLELARPREVIQIGAQGLKGNPSDVAGRMMVGRAFMLLHQWKQAQTEFLKIVKKDKHHPQGFLCLGEVLLRLQDFDRALPVLQHAQNLSPADSHVLTLVKHARTRQPLPPPPPIPKPLPIRKGRESRGINDFVDESPTRVADPSVIEQLQVTSGVDLVETGEILDVLPDPGGLDEEVSFLLDPEGFAPQQSAQMPRPQSPKPHHNLASQSDLHAGSQSGSRTSQENLSTDSRKVRPRIISPHKPKDAAHAPLRASAAVGEDYLHHLLADGLLNFPNIPVPRTVLPRKRRTAWGRMLLRGFLFTAAITLVAAGGGFAWYYQAKSQKVQDVKDYGAQAEALMTSGTAEDFKAALLLANKAVSSVPDNFEALCTYAMTAGVSGVVHGSPIEKAREALVQVAELLPQLTETPDKRRLVIARGAVTLATLDTQDSGKSRLADAKKELSEHLAKQPDDAFSQWLMARIELASGQREKGKALLEKVHASGKGPVLATIQLGDLAVDEGNLDGAHQYYDAALERVPDHPLALAGKALIWAGGNVEIAKAAEVLNVKLSNVESLQVQAYRNLAWALSAYALEDYDDFVERLGKATSLSEPRFRAWIVLGYILAGDLIEAKKQRSRIRFYGSAEPDVQPFVDLVDAELLYADGRWKQALAMIQPNKNLKSNSPRAHNLLGRLLLAANRSAAALDAFEAGLAIAPQDREGQLWREAARMIANRSMREDAAKKLEKLRRATKTNLASYIYGYGLARSGKRNDAKEAFERSLSTISEDFPNPVIDRVHAELARIAMSEEEWDTAQKHAKIALKHNPDYLPVRGILAQLAVRNGNFSRALSTLRDIVGAGIATPQDHLSFVTALLGRSKITNAERKEAREAITQAQASGVNSESFRRLVWRFDPELAGELGLKAP